MYSHYCKTKWGNELEIGSDDVKREEVEKLVRVLMGAGEKGEEMRRNAKEWKTKAEEGLEWGRE
ncbi:7-deoxyloganetin glucosyltransferase-like [Cucumis melo var. makuwa]|uniref:7-deoxyloganetin glucosyltransferase-like n=1 Tax=Cucumis melo var. makuwa TaxID=1194695 RepID=A0A5A7SK39_CUCMM|nr:7-deoxyloganetin glucosyltransferase-like [Cucumis melo var. makuwa]TYK06957.1 7-deoxyloganetin glucosyltransferase-like [Cucumis melo var. makuwa]